MVNARRIAGVEVGHRVGKLRDGGGDRVRLPRRHVELVDRDHRHPVDEALAGDRQAELDEVLRPLLELVHVIKLLALRTLHQQPSSKTEHVDPTLAERPDP